mmetsp:Transcript_45645/g.105447  ORF Transcript_45645/g.105447 Transcript_45645/m.105447 type:complete len:90 (+) Transcript_45645:57-326(+)
MTTTICGQIKQLEALCNGCRNECDQKCVIDNHEVEILQSPSIETPHLVDSCCPSVRAADFCTPRQTAYAHPRLQASERSLISPASARAH